MDRVERGEVYLAVLDGRPVGNIVLQWSDEETWGDAPDDAGYVHGLAIRRELAGHGLGRGLLRWAENRELNAYYERAGFRFLGRADAWGLEVSLYEKKVGTTGTNCVPKA